VAGSKPGCWRICVASTRPLLADITQNDRAVKGELADKIKAALDEFAADFA
jgi:hypothetical protein